MPATAQELQELVLLARESGDIDLETKALEQFIALQGQGQSSLDQMPELSQASINPASLSDQFKGLLEVPVSMVGGELGEALGGAAGLGTAILSQDAKAGEAVQKQISENIAQRFQPQTEEGKANLRAIGENEYIQKIGKFLESAEQIGGDFGFDLLQPVEEALGIENLAELGGAAGTALPTALLEAFPAFFAGRAAAKGAKKVGPSIAEGVKETAQDVKDVFQFQTPTKKRIAEKIAEGSTDIDTAKFTLKPAPLKGAGMAIKDPQATAAIKQGFDEGVIAAVKNSSPEDRAKMVQMSDIKERGLQDNRYAAEHRPSDIVGQSVTDRFKVVHRANKLSGKEINKVAETLKGKPIDIEAATSGFADSLNDLGVRLVDDGKGGKKPDFEFSQLGPGDRGPLKEVIRQMNIIGGTVDGFAAHRMKRVIDNNVTFGKVKTGMSGDAERALKSFRASLDDSLDSQFPKYNEANTVYAETIGALDAFQDVAGKKMNLTGPNSDKAVGTLMRRVLSNAQSRVRLIDSVNEIETIANKYINLDFGPKRIGPAGKGFTDDLLNQVLFVDELDARFGAIARTSFQGEIEQGAKQAARAATTKAGAADAAIGLAAKSIEKARGVSDEAAFKAIKDLLRGTE